MIVMRTAVMMKVTMIRNLVNKSLTSKGNKNQKNLTILKIVKNKIPEKKS